MSRTLPKALRMRQGFDMAHFDDIYDIAADGYGIITSAQAREAGAAPSELNRRCADGRLLRRGHGVYMLARWAPTLRRLRGGRGARGRRDLPAWRVRARHQVIQVTAN